jgi:transposase-like protein
MANPNVARESGAAESAAGVRAMHAAVMPQCPRCGWHDVRPSMIRTALDRALSALSLSPFRCRSCGHRFYRFFKRMSAS